MNITENANGTATITFDNGQSYNVDSLESAIEQTQEFGGGQDFTVTTLDNNTQTMGSNVAGSYAQQEGVANQTAANVGEVSSGYTDMPGTAAEASSYAQGTATNVTTANVQALADLTFLSQNTGVASATLNAAYEALGIDSSNPIAFTEAYKILEDYGYKPGSNENFYGNNSAQDVSAQILYDRWQNAPTDEELIEAGLNPDDFVVVNNNVANQTYLQQQLESMGGVGNVQTNASFQNLNEGQSIEQNRIDFDDQVGNSSYWGQFDSPSEAALDMLEWDLLLKEKLKEGDDTTGAATGTPGSGTGAAGAGGVSGDFTNEQDPILAVNRADMPGSTGDFTSNLAMTTPGPSGTYTVPAQTFGANVTNQVDALSEREEETAALYQPQTIAEKQAAGQDVSAYQITQKLYRNPNTGAQLYIVFQGGKPLQPIPAGYVEVQQSGELVGAASVYNPLTAGGNTYTTGAYGGGYIQGFSGEDGSTVTDTALDPNKIYGNVSFQDPVTGQTITQTPAQYLQSLGNRQAQATFNPATMVTMPGTSKMFESTSPGTILESTAGQSLGTAPMITGTQLAQVSDVSQAKGPGTPAIMDETGKVISAAVDTPTSVDATVKAAAPALRTELMGGTTTNYQGMANAVSGASWDAKTGTFLIRDTGASPDVSPRYFAFTPEEFAQNYNLNLGDYMTTTGGFQPETLDRDRMKEITGQTQLRQKVNPDGTPAIDAEGNPIMETFTSASNVTAATDTAQTVADVVGQAGIPQRRLDQTTGGIGELITGTGVDQGQVTGAFGTGEVQAASIQDELATLMSQFDDGQTPAWAAGAMRKANAVMSERGLGASSMAGQAVIQAAMEAALPIAQIDAGNKQQMALFKAEQRSKFLQIEFDQAFQRKVTNAARVSEIANINFSADQQIALENSRAAQTMDLASLNNEQALIMAEAAALSQVDMANLSNLQQSAVQNAQNFLQLDMANLNNKQSTALFKAQSVTNAMLSDTAQANANEQFNATSENQMTQFSSNLSAQVSQFNAAQQNAINQFNAEEANAVLEFNSALQNQREMFNAQNYLVVAQANAKWRQDLTTANTAAQNVSNLTYAKEVNGLTQKALDDYWQKERDIMSYSFAQAESASDRALKILLGEQSLAGIRMKLEFDDNAAKSEWWSDLLFGDTSFADIFKLSDTTTGQGV